MKVWTKRQFHSGASFPILVLPKLFLNSLLPTTTFSDFHWISVLYSLKLSVVLDCDITNNKVNDQNSQSKIVLNLFPIDFFSKICKYEWIFVVASMVAVSGSGQAWLKINTLDIRPRFCQQQPGHTQSELFIKIVLTCWLSVYYQTNPAIINSTWMILNDYWTSATRTILWAFINLIDDDFSFRDKLTQMNVLSCMSVHPFFFSATPHLL